MKKFLVIILFAFLTARTVSAENSTKVDIYGDLNGSFIASFATPEGKESIKFNKIDSKKYLATYADSDGLFFKGKKLRETINNSNPRASADLIDGILHVNFHGRRNERTYLLTVEVTGSGGSYSGRLAHVSNKIEMGCATAEHPARLSADLPDPETKPQFFRELSVSLDADYSFYKSFLKTAKARRLKTKEIDTARKRAVDTMRSTINTVNSIYSEQLGIVVVLNDIKVDTTGSRSATSKDSEVVLDSFKDNVKKLNYLTKADVYHLFTGNKMSGSVVGLAYVGITCRRDLLDYSVGLSRLTNPAVQSLITAHEIAHNLGATHIEGDNSIMSPVLSPEKNKFIPVSYNQIQNYINDFGICLDNVTL
jgi:hypothetical protein